jgi:hypothetical protein
VADNGFVIAAAADTSASVTGVALVVGLMALGALLLLEVNTRNRRSVTPPPGESTTEAKSQFRKSWDRANTFTAYGPWVTGYRVVLVTVGVLGLLVAGIAALA